MIFPCDYVYTYQFVVFKNVKSVLKMKKIKKVLTPRGTALPPEVLSCRRGVRRQVYTSRIFWFDHSFFENQSKKNIKENCQFAVPYREKNCQGFI
jgi:hypothetical protein